MTLYIRGYVYKLVLLWEDWWLGSMMGGLKASGEIFGLRVIVGSAHEFWGLKIAKNGVISTGWKCLG